MEKIQLREICHSREGDKGDIANLSLIVYDKGKYELIRRYVTVDRVKGFFRGIVKGNVERYEFPKLGALNFILHGALGGGITRSLSIDGHGKSLSSYFLSLEIEVPDEEKRS